MREFHKWWPPFRVAVLHGSTAVGGKGDIISTIARAGPGNVLLTTYAAMKNHRKRLLQYDWHYVILDEGHIVCMCFAALPCQE